MTCFRFVTILAITFVPFIAQSCRQSVDPPPTSVESDTTTYSYEWQNISIGDGNGSVVNDVSVVNDSCIWIVGEFYYKDSTTDYKLYNAAMWNGTKIALFQFQARDYGTIVGVFPLKTVYAFSSSMVIFTNLGDVIKWNGSSCAEVAFFIRSLPYTGQIVKTWASSPTEFYCVGMGGAIYHYSQSSWNKLSSLTTLVIGDVWGIVKEGKESIFCAATSFGTTFPSKILTATEGSVDSIFWAEGRDINSIWTKDGSVLFVGGSGVYDNSGGKWTQANIGANFYINCIRGNDTNDIFAVGAEGLISHFNGKSWKVQQQGHAQSYFSVSVNGSTVAAVGVSGAVGMLSIGKRIN